MRLPRRLGLTLLFLASAFTAITGAQLAMDFADTPTPPVGLNLMAALRPEIEELRGAGRDAGPRHVVFLGDSISISTAGQTTPVPQALRREIGRLGASRDVELHSLAALGTGPFDYYFLADEIADAEPDAAVIAFSLNAFGETFRRMNRSENSGWIAPGRLARAGAMPIHWIGLTYDQLLMNALIVGAGGFDAWHWLAGRQARLGAARDDLARWLGERFGRRGPQTFQLARFSYDRERTRLPGLDRYNAASELRHYGPVLTRLDASHPVLEMLAGTVELFERRHIRVLVYVNPINVEHLTAVGVFPSSALDESLARVEAAVVGAGGEWLDLHALLPDGAFRDAAGHFGGSVDGTSAIAKAVAARLVTPR